MIAGDPRRRQLHGKTGAAPRSVTPTQKLSPLRSVIAGLDELGDGAGLAAGPPAYRPSAHVLDEVQAEAEQRVANAKEAARAIDEVAANHEAVVAFSKAERELDRGDFARALGGFRSALQLGHPEPAACHAECGGCLEELSRWAEAAAEYGWAIGLRPAHALYRSSRGYALKELGKLQAAAGDFAQALVLDPEDEDAAEQLSAVQVSIGAARLSKLRLQVGRRRTAAAKEMARLAAALPAAVAAAVSEVGGLEVVAALAEESGLEPDVEASIDAIHQAIGAAILGALPEPEPEPEPEPKQPPEQLNGRGSQHQASAAVRSVAEVADPSLRADLASAQAVEAKITRNRATRKQQEMARWREEAIAREKRRTAQGPRRAVDADMQELIRLQRRVAEAAAREVGGALGMAAAPVSQEAEDMQPLERVERGATVVEEEDWRAQLSDVGRGLLASDSANAENPEPEPEPEPRQRQDSELGPEVVPEPEPEPPAAVPSALHLAAAAQAESVQALTQELRAMIDSAPPVLAVGADEEEDWRAQLSDVGTSLIANATTTAPAAERPVQAVPSARERTYAARHQKLSASVQSGVEDQAASSLMLSLGHNRGGPLSPTTPSRHVSQHDYVHFIMLANTNACGVGRRASTPR
eukprot:COSAG04_NODE_490_length_13483_cov_5.310646_7_plen_641_part_00